MKYCCFLRCRSDARSHKDVTFYPVPKPGRKDVNLEICKKWVSVINRETITVRSVKPHHYVCNLHFVDKLGPTKENPYPMPFVPPATVIEPDKELLRVNKYSQIKTYSKKNNYNIAASELHVKDTYVTSIKSKTRDDARQDNVSSNQHAEEILGLPHEDNTNNDFYVTVKTEPYEPSLPSNILIMPISNAFGVTAEGSANAAQILTEENISHDSNALMLTEDFQDINDCFVKFLKFQIQDTKHTLAWGISHRSNSLLVYSTDIGILRVEINEALKMKTQINGIILNESHSLSPDKFPNAGKNLTELIHYLNSIDKFKRCIGNPEEEFRRFASPDNNNNFILNSYTNAIHSAKCEGLFVDLRRSVRCQSCCSIRSLLTKRIKRATTLTTRAETITFRCMSSNQQLDYLRKARNEKKQLKRAVRNLRRRLMKRSSSLVRKKIRQKTKSKKLCNKDHLRRLLTRRMLRNKINKTNESDLAMIKWCSEINAISTMAYEAFREVIPLPSPKRLYGYISIFSAKSGFSEDIISKMKTKIDLDELEEHQKYFSVIIEEIKIEHDLVYSQSTGKIIGYTKLNTNLPSSPSRFITLVVRGLTTNFKHTLGYFPSLNIGVQELHSISQEAIKLLENSGFKVLTVVCDKSPLCEKFIKISADFDHEKGIAYKWTNTYAECKAPRHIFYIFDSTGLIKAVRNCWFHSGFEKTRLLTKNGKNLIWEHLEEMFRKNLLSWHGFCPKLTNQHLSPWPLNSVKIKLATQVISSTVANALEKLVGKKSSETVKFVRYFDKMFDIINSKNVSQGITKTNSNLKPFQSATDERLQWLENDFLGYLKDWKEEVERMDIYPDDKLKMQLSRQTQDAIFITVHSIVEATRLLLHEGAPFVSTDKFNQYPLDSCFGKHSRIPLNTENS